MVEFALVIGFVFLLFVAMMQLILMMSAYNTLADAAKEGVRYAIVHGTGNSNCSGPGNPTSNPIITCGDPTGSTNVKPVVTNFAGLSFQNVTNVTIDYDPNGANTASPRYGQACSAPGCMVKITVSHAYTPLFGLGWPSVTISAAASGRIMN